MSKYQTIISTSIALPLFNITAVSFFDFFTEIEIEKKSFFLLKDDSLFAFQTYIYMINHKSDFLSFL